MTAGAAARGREPRARIHAAARKLFGPPRQGACAQRRQLARSKPARSLGIVGESGSGKSTFARLVMALDRPTSGSVALLGRDLHALPREELRQARRDIQMVFQDPYGSLDPRQTIARIVAEPLAAWTTPAATSSAHRAADGAAVGRPARQRPGQVSARILRRPAPAHRHRARADHPAAADRRRRAGQRARRLGAGAGAQSDAGPAGRSSASPTC